MRIEMMPIIMVPRHFTGYTYSFHPASISI
jgi:hypothetical protein